MDKREVVARIQATNEDLTGWVHDVPCTETYVAIFESAVVFGQKNKKGSASYGPFGWEEGFPGKMILVNHKTGEYKTYKVGAGREV